jgi:hypothetical protein
MDPILNEYLDAVRRWMDEVEAIPLPEARPSGLSSQEKLELRRIEGLIDQLKAHGVTSIPAELVDKQRELAARDVPAPTPSAAAKFLPYLEELCRNLGELSQKARILRHHVRSRTAINGPRAHYDVEPLDLLNAGYLSTDDRLELQWSNNGGVFEGRLESDGRILANTPQDGWKAFPSLSSAASYISGRPQNGWDHWRKIDNEGNRIPLKKIREHYRKETDVS